MLELMALLRDFATVGTPAVLAWYLWYHQTVAGPRKDQTQSEQLEKLQATQVQQLTQLQQMYEARIDKIVDQFLEALAEERVERRRENELMRQAFRCDVRD